jgi:hypothetical protein
VSTSAIVTTKRSRAVERIVIALAVSGITVGVRIVVLLPTRGLLPAATLGDMRVFIAAFLTPLLLLPWGLLIAGHFDRCRANGCRWRMGALVAIYVCACAFAAVGIYYAVLFVTGRPSGIMTITRFGTQQAVWNLVLLLIAHGIQRAIQGHRATRLERERRHDIEMADAKSARQTIESRTRPDTVITALDAIAERSLTDPAAARLLLLRLARHQRMLLTRSSPPSFEDELRIIRSTVTLFRPNVHLEIGRCDALPDPDAVQPWLRRVERTLMQGPDGHSVVECERREQSAVLRLLSRDTRVPDAGVATFELPLAAPQAKPPVEETSGEFAAASGSGAFTAALVAYLVSSVTPDLGSLEVQELWNLTVLTLTSAVLWLVIGPVLSAITTRCVRLRLSLAVLLSAAAALSSAAVATAAAYGTLRLLTVGKEFMLAFLPLVASRNANVAFVVCASSFGEGLSRQLIAARADVMRAERETIGAEARELEARFHPHFLFNALTSIAGLIRLDPAAAGEMCRLLARLVARTQAYAGVASWSVDEEVTLIADYLAIQRRRFAERFRIARWDVAPAMLNVAIPRLSLQPLVENIFIHAVAASYDVIAIGLTIEQRGRTLAVEIWNDAADGPAARGHGRGLAFVSNRVNDAGGKILVVPGQERFTVQLTIPI